MNETTIKFTEFSKNPNDYGFIHANLNVPYTQYSTLTIDSLTTNACFEVLNSNDYLKLKKDNDVFTIQFTKSYSDLNSETLAMLLHDMFMDKDIDVSVDTTNRIMFLSKNKFSLVECSYNLQLLLGIYDQTLPLESNAEGDYQVIHCLAVGSYLSTPILYLIGSIGGKCFVKNGNGYSNRRVLMRINNSFSPNFPVIASNSEFKVYTLSNDLSNIEFELVDARFRKVKLLTPMYICGTVIGNVEAETIFTGMICPDQRMEKVSENSEFTTVNEN